MKDAAYQCPKEVAEAVESLRVLLRKHYGDDGFTFLLSANAGKLLAAGNRPLAGGNIKARPE